MLDGFVEDIVDEGETFAIKVKIGRQNSIDQNITLFTQGLFAVPDELRQKLQEHGYQIIETPIEQFLGEDHQMNGVELKDGNTIELETGLISMGSKYHAAYLEKFNFCYSLLPISPSSGVSLPIFNCFLLRLSCFHNDLICL
jgi:hypothetical protein